ncbi:MAG: hypothetical protein Q8N23_14560 [Archangium sp.]|nr:hypothetical protein [Archangium sp.]MDP3569392.1 hypothetical protein [Archangium sp.]
MKLRAVLEEHVPAGRIEYLPVKLKDKKKKPVAGSYQLANVLTVVDCADMKRSRYTMDPLVKSQVHRFRLLVLDEEKIPGDVNIFRLANHLDLVLVREDLGKAILRAKATGVEFVDLESYNEGFRRPGDVGTG